MTAFLLRLCNGYFEMCLAGTVVLCIVLLVRGLAYKRVQKKYLWLLWLAVFFRLLCPVTVEGPVPDLWSRFESAKVQEKAEDGEGITGQEVPSVLSSLNSNREKPSFVQIENVQTVYVTPREHFGVQGESAASQPMSEENAAPEWISGIKVVAFLTSLMGTIGFCVWGIRKYIRTYGHLRTSAKSYVEEGEVWVCDGITSPMVFGLLKPRIYLPLHFQENVEEKELQLILLHEQAHIRRGDFFWKLMSFFVLGLHWWNPFVWLAVKLFVKDMEMACDERVLEAQGGDQRERYAKALLHFSMRQSGIFMPVAFGESNTESRVKNILRYHKRTVIVSGVTFAIMLVLFLCLVTRPHEMGQNPGEENQAEQEMGMENETETEPGASGAEDTEANEGADGTAVNGGESETEPEKESQTAEEVQIPEGPITTAQVARAAFRAPDPGKSQESILLSSQTLPSDWEDPVKAVELLLNLEGGTGVYQRKSSYETGECGYVTYTFEDGTHVTYGVSNGKEMGLSAENIWIPTWILHEESEEWILQETAEINSCLQGATAERLRSITETPSDPWSLSVEDRFFLLDEDKEFDLALYGLSGGSGMVLRSGETCYPIYHDWVAQYGTVDFYTGDYDGDGQQECALICDQGGGTGVYLEYLYILEEMENGLAIYKFDNERVCGQIDRVDFLWDEESKFLQATADGENVVLEVSLQEALGEHQMRGLNLGEQLSFVCREGQWYVLIGGGVLVEGWAITQYDLFSLTIETPVYYTGGDFETGEITMSYKF